MDMELQFEAAKIHIFITRKRLKYAEHTIMEKPVMKCLVLSNSKSLFLCAWKIKNLF
jgi:hypothetical protein